MLIYEASDSSSLRKKFAWADDCLSNSSLCSRWRRMHTRTLRFQYHFRKPCISSCTSRPTNGIWLSLRCDESRLCLVEIHLRFNILMKWILSKHRQIDNARKKAQIFSLFQLYLVNSSMHTVHSTQRYRARQSLCLLFLFRTTKYNPCASIYQFNIYVRHAIRFDLILNRRIRV